MSREYLVFTLSATLGAMGELAGHERRSSWAWPGRSAVLGLCAAALGIRRTGDFRALDTLRLAVGVYDSGTPLRDFHTVQSVPAAAVRHPLSRGDALRRGRGKLDTTITLRDYHSGCIFGVAIWSEGEQGTPLSSLREALLKPVFPLYLGRKSCPLNAPVRPLILQSDDEVAALSAGVIIPEWVHPKPLRQVWSEEPTADGMIYTRHDCPLDRQAWHFAPRQVRRIDLAAIGGPTNG